MKVMRLSGLMRKEVYEILRDPSSIAIAFVLPLVLLLIFGYGVSLDARHISMAEVVDHPTQLTASFLAELQRSPWFRPSIYPDQASAEQALLHGRADAILWLRSDFTRLSYSSGSATIHLTVNGVDANQARIIENYVNGTWLLWLQEEATRQSTHLPRPVVADTRVWFNPVLRSRDYLIPGLIAIIMTLIGALLTALVVAREWERGTMEGIMVTPVGKTEILLGKLIDVYKRQTEMLVHESRILQVTLFSTLQNNLSFLDFSLLLPDVMTIADEVDAQLTQSMASYIRAMRKAAAA